VKALLELEERGEEDETKDEGELDLATSGRPEEVDGLDGEAEVVEADRVENAEE